MKRVRIRNRRADVCWPPYKCACCGERVENAETATLVMFKKVEEHRTYKWPMLFPSCAMCKEHQEIALGASDWYPAGCGCGIIVIGLVLIGGGVHLLSYGLYYIALSWIAWVLLYATVAAWLDKQNRAAAKDSMKPVCTGPIFVRYRREPPEPSEKYAEIFEFTNDAYADEFRILNGVSRTTPGDFT